jgi:signal peptidase I
VSGGPSHRTTAVTWLRAAASERTRRSIRPAVALVCWTYLSVSLALVAWVAVAAVSTGWRPTLVVSDSMSPGMHAGDVVLYDTRSASTAGVGSVVVFSADRGEQVIHRIVAIEAGGVVITKGDANGSTDRVIDAGRVDGLVRLMVPRVGLPLLWLRTGNHALFGAWLVATIGAIAGATPTVRRRLPGPAAPTPRAAGRPSPTGATA